MFKIHVQNSKFRVRYVRNLKPLLKLFVFFFKGRSIRVFKLLTGCTFCSPHFIGDILEVFQLV